MSLPPLKTFDLHWLFDPAPASLKAFDGHGGQLFHCECRNRTTADGQYGHDGNCPPGDFVLGVPETRNTVPFGAWFVPILDFGENRTMAEHGRAGIGIHGGGTGLPQPFAPRQGWQVTHGCLRVQNEELAEIVHLVRAAHRAAGRCYLTVNSRGQGMPMATESEWAPIADLAPGE